MKYKCLSVAGFDSSGGAGLQADLKTFSALGCYGMTVLTALPIQNTCGVKNCFEIPLQAIQEQLEILFEDMTPDSIKIGMLFSAPIIELVADFLLKYAKNIPIVLDPVMVAKSGDSLLLANAVDTLKTRLIPLCHILTPNIPEAHTLVGYKNNRESLADELLQLGAKAVFLKGGHDEGCRSDDLYMDREGLCQWFRAERIESKNTHGTGCTLSSAICALLAKGISPIQACKCAKNYLFEAIFAAQNNSVGKGHGPVHHFYHLWKD